MDERALAEELVGILSDLIALPSPYPPGDTRAICGYAARRLERAGYAVEVLARAEGVDNAVGRMGSGAPQLVFNAHADTVGVGERSAWRTDPFQACKKSGNRDHCRDQYNSCDSQPAAARRRKMDAIQRCQHSKDDTCRSEDHHR